jgi:sugar/nucleoside kinase (ribokinase family)
VATVLVAGLVNIETTLQIERFPIDYSPVLYPFWGVDTTVSGVGYNVAKALTTLGDDVRFLSLVGRDSAGSLVSQRLARDRIAQEGVLHTLNRTAQSVILYETGGRRQINVDLKDIQQRSYPRERFEPALEGCNVAVLCNINFARPLLAIARRHSVPIATDVHTISDLEDPYNRDFMEAAGILFMSDELLPTTPERWAEAVLDQYAPDILVIGLGERGALLAVREENRIARVEPIYTRPVVGTIGAGDALFSAFVHSHAHGFGPLQALERAMVFASFKLGEKGAADGFLTEAELASWIGRVG